MGDSFRDKDCLSQIASVKDVLKDIMGNAGKLSITTSNTAWGGTEGRNPDSKNLTDMY
jgi:hypothetical protein